MRLRDKRAVNWYISDGKCNIQRQNSVINYLYPVIVSVKAQLCTEMHFIELHTFLALTISQFPPLSVCETFE